MGASSFRIGLVRLVMGAAFMLLAFFLASTTQARADDLGLLGTAVVAETVEKVAETATDLVDAPSGHEAPSATVTEVVSDPVKAVDKVVAEPVKVVVAEPAKVVEKPLATVQSIVPTPARAVEAVVAEPLAAVTRTTTAAVTTTTTVVESAAVAIVRTVEPIVAPVTDDVVAPVVRAVDPIVRVTDPGLSVIDPVVADSSAAPAVGLLVPGASGDHAVVLPGAPGTDTATDMRRSLVVPGAARAGALAAGAASGGRSAAVTSSVVASSPLQQVESVERASGPGRPSDTPAPRPAHLALGSVPASGSTGSSGSNGPDAATSPITFTLPESSSAAVTSATSPLCPGPVLDPGSRPD